MLPRGDSSPSRRVTLDPPAIHVLDLPPDAVLPGPGGPDADEGPTLTPRAEPSPPPETIEQRRALHAWILGHHAFFLCLAVATYAARQVTRAATALDLDGATTWMRRLADLRMGMAAFTCAAGDMSRETYEGFIRLEMVKVNPELSGLSSLEGWAFDDAIQQMKPALAALGDRLPEARANVARGLPAIYAAADRKWWEHHAKLMRRLLTEPVSLARKGASDDPLDERPRYGDLKVKHRTPPLIAVYDRFFACRRRPVSLAQFERSTWFVLERTRPHQRRDPELLSFFTRGENVMNEIIQDRRRT